MDRPKLVRALAAGLPVGAVRTGAQVGEDFELQSIAEQDNLRERIWKACDMPLEVLWLSVCFTGDERWS